MNTTTSKIRRTFNRAVIPGSAIRNAAFYDNVVWVRSPYTGTLIPPRCSRNPSRPPKTNHPSRVPLAVILGVAVVALGIPFVLPDAKERTSSLMNTEIAVPLQAAKVSATSKPPIAKPKSENKGQISSVSNDYEALVEKAKTEKGRERKIAIYRKALAINPNGHEAMSRLSVLLVDSPKTRDEALRLAEKAISISSDNAIAWLTVAYFHHLGGRRSKALEAYRKCASAKGPESFIEDCRRMI